MILTYYQQTISFPCDFDIFQKGDVLYHVAAKLSWGHLVTITNIHKEEVGQLNDPLINYFPAFKVTENGKVIGELKRVLSLKQKRYDFRYLGWMVRGMIDDPVFDIVNQKGAKIATFKRQNAKRTLTIYKPQDHLRVILFVLGIEALLSLDI